jgi:hypothetical protein
VLDFVDTARENLEDREAEEAGHSLPQAKVRIEGIDNRICLLNPHLPMPSMSK